MTDLGKNGRRPGHRHRLVSKPFELYLIRLLDRHGLFSRLFELYLICLLDRHGMFRKPFEVYLIRLLDRHRLFSRPFELLLLELLCCDGVGDLFWNDFVPIAVLKDKLIFFRRQA